MVYGSGFRVNPQPEAPPPAVRSNPQDVTNKQTCSQRAKTTSGCCQNLTLPALAGRRKPLRSLQKPRSHPSPDQPHALHPEAPSSREHAPRGDTVPCRIPGVSPEREPRVGACCAEGKAHAKEGEHMTHGAVLARAGVIVGRLGNTNRFGNSDFMSGGRGAGGGHACRSQGHSN